MTLWQMILTTAVSLVVIAGSFYIGKFVGYMKGVHEMMSSFMNMDLKQIVKDELKEYMDGTSK